MIYTILIFVIIAILFLLKAASLCMRYDTTKRRIKPNYVANNKVSIDSVMAASDKLMADIDDMLQNPPSLPSPFSSISKPFTPQSNQWTAVGYGGGGSGASVSNVGGNPSGASPTSFHTTTQQTITFPLSVGIGQTSNFYKKRGTLQTLLELQVPKSTWIRHYILGDKAKDDPEWKKDFLEFCVKNDVDMDESDLDRGELLV